jgi:hypothetical protein
MPAKTGPIRNDIMESRFAFIPLSGKDLSALFQSEAWNAFDYHNAQLIFQLSDRLEAPRSDMPSLKDINRMVLAKF